MKKRHLLLLLMAFAFVPLAMNGQETLTIGTGTSYATGSSSSPTLGSVMGNTYNYYAITQSIYTASELQGAKTITSVAFYHNAYSFTTNLTIYLVHTSLSTISGSNAITSGTANYTGTSITVGGDSAGWQTFTLDTPFEYNGTDNLLVVVVRSHSSGYKTPQGWQYTSTSSNYRYIARSSDTSGYGTLSNGNSTYSYSQSYYRPNIQIGYEEVFTITVSANPTNGGIVTGGGTYTQGEECTVTATANSGYTFTNWTENGTVVSTNASYTINNVTANHTLVANFTKTHSLNLYTNNNPGSIEASYEWNDSTININNGDQVPERVVVHLEAVPDTDTGYDFDRWSIDNGNGTFIDAELSDNPIDFRMGTRSCSVTANFIPITFNITYHLDGGTWNSGTNPNPTTYTIETETFTLNNPTKTGNEFAGWTGTGLSVATPQVTIAQGSTGNREYTANWTPKNYSISYNSVSPTTDCNISGINSADYGDTVTVNINVAIGYELDSISAVDDNNQTVTLTGTGNTRTFTMPASNVTVTASFKAKTFNITYSPNSINATNGCYLSGDGTATFGSNVMVNINKATGYELDSISAVDDNDETVALTGTGNTRTFTMPASNVIVNATFTATSQPTYTITVSANPTSGGTVSGGGTYTQGEECTVTATANSGYTFTNWTENGTVVDTVASYTFTVSGNRTLVANFTPNGTSSYTVSVSANPTNGGNVTGGGTFQQGQSCTVVATPNANYTFTNWTENGNVVSTSASYAFTVNANRTLVANFSQQTQTYTITVSANPANGGNVTGGGTFSEGQSCTVEASPANGYLFTNWTEEGSVVSTNASYTFTVNANRTLVANFQKEICVDDVQEIVAKEHTEGDETYILMLIYPNIDSLGNPNDEEYTYRWYYSQDGESYSKLTTGTYDKQYYYVGGRLKEGYYKVRISKEGCSNSVDTQPYYVNYDSRLLIYPNPSRRGDNVVVVNRCNGPAQLTIYSTDGRLLHSQMLTDSQTSINIHLPQGVYVAYITNSEGYTKVGKLIIQ